MVALTAKDFREIRFETASEEPFSRGQLTGFNRKILNVGEVWQFYECVGCGNATAGKPDKCEKCNTRSFRWVNIKAAISGVGFLK